MGPPGKVWMHETEPGSEGCSPAFRSVAAAETLPLPKEFEGCQTLYETFANAARKYPFNRCLGHRLRQADGSASDYIFDTFKEVACDVNQVAKSLVNSNAGKGKRVGIYGANSPEWIKAMVACSSVAAICVPLYDSYAADSAAYCIVHSGMELAFAQDTKLSDLARAVSKADAEWRACRDGKQEAPAAGLGAEPVSLKKVVVWGEGFQPNGSHAAAVQVLKDCGVQEVVPYSDFSVCSPLHLPGSPSPHSKQSTEGSPAPAGAAGSGTSNPAAKPTSSSPGSTKPSVPIERPGPEDLCTIMYTSGTTGCPKGVMLTHRALVSVVSSQIITMRDPWGEHALAHIQQLAELPEELRSVHPPPSPSPNPRTFPTQAEGDAHLSYLPLAHIYERAMVEACLATGAAVGCWQGDVNKVQDDAAALKPAIMVGVPRVWERVKDSVYKKLDARTPIARYLFRFFYERKLRRLQEGVSLEYASVIGDALVFRKVRAALGGSLKLIISGAAPLPRELEEFVRVTLCCYMGQGYGLTETCSATCLAPPDCFEMVGCVGPVQTCADCKVVSVPEMGYSANDSTPKGELLLRGPCMFSGYYRDDQATKAVLQEDGWFHTGDIAEIQANGALRIIDRLKNICKLAQGEYVALEVVETAIAGRCADWIANGCVWVYADSTKRRVVAVVVPQKEALLRWAEEAGLSSVVQDGGFEALCSHPQAVEFMLSKLADTAQEKGLPRFQHPAAVHLEPHEWSVEKGLLTPTHKLKRHELRAHYSEQLARLYASINE